MVEVSLDLADLLRRQEALRFCGLRPRAGRWNGSGNGADPQHDLPEFARRDRGPQRGEEAGPHHRHLVQPEAVGDVDDELPIGEPLGLRLARELRAHDGRPDREDGVLFDSLLEAQAGQAVAQRIAEPSDRSPVWHRLSSLPRFRAAGMNSVRTGTL